jgi:hypothetical protein
MQVVREMFPERDTSLRGELPWPASSPDLSACDYFLWKYLKIWLVGWFIPVAPTWNIGHP